MQQRRWQTVIETSLGDPSLQRCSVPGGWLYRTILHNEEENQVALAFVPKPAPERREKHDA